MAVFSGPEIPNNGLVFYYDSNNIQKSWRGKPTTNFFTNGHFSGGNGIPQEGASNPTNEIIVFPNPGNSEYVLRQTGTTGSTEYQLNLTTQLSPSTTYTLSGWYAESPNYSSTDGSRMFHAVAFSTSGAHAGLGIGIGTVVETKVVDGITWKYCYASITTPADYNNVFCWFVGYGPSNYTGYRYYTNLQMELGTIPSRYVNGTRSNTQAVLDLTNNNTLIANGLSYAANNTFSFNGTTDRIYTSTNPTYSNNATWEAWVLRTSSLNTYNMFMGRYLPYFGIMSDNKIIFSNRVGGSQQTIYSNGFSAVNNTWYHLAFSTEYDGTTNTTARIYINGVLNNSALQTGAHTQEVERFTIGTWYSTDTAYPFQGKVDSVKVYNRTLSAREIRQNFEASRSRYGI